MSEVQYLNATTEAVYTINNEYYPEVYRRQGGCFTGKCFYQVLISKDESIARVVKKNVETGEVIYSDPVPLNHGNDMTYNPKTNKVVVCHASNQTISVFDADTLKHEETRVLPRGGSSISYSPERDLYILGSRLFKCVSADYEDMRIEFNDDPSTSSLTTQGIATDENYVYSLLCKGIGKAMYECYVAVYDWEGNFVKFITFSVENNYEPEHISVVDGEIYVGCCSPQPVATLYKLKF